LSGRYPATTEVVGNGTDLRVALGADFKFLPEYFRSHGYFTAGIGKVTHTPEHQNAIQWDVGFDPQYAADSLYKGTTEELIALPEAAHPDHITARTIARLIEEKKDRPFFMVAGFHKPHSPRVAPQKYFEMYPYEQMKPPTGSVESDIPRIAIPPNYEPELNEDGRKKRLQSYYACVSFMDAQVGLIFEALDRRKLWNETIVVFLGDNGYHLGDHGGFWGKMSLMDKSARVPFMIHAPGMAAHAVCSRAVELVDLFPTLTALCRMPDPGGLEGASLVPLLQEPVGTSWSKPARSVAVRGEKRDGMLDLGRSVHTDQYTFIQWPDGARQLYDDLSDPGQTRNLAANPEYVPLLAALENQLLPEDRIVAHGGIKSGTKDKEKKQRKKNKNRAAEEN
jgi:arylsulfatase A-like enzyme